jgi:flagellar motor switch protein FliN/FliY
MNEASAPAPDDRRLEAVLDVDLPLVVRFGSTSLPIRTLSSLGAGSVVDLNRAPDDPVDLLVGDRVIARGEVVVVDGQYGVRITELLNQARPSAATLEA